MALAERTELVMWSAEFTGRASPLSAQQRLLFPIVNDSETTERQLGSALISGFCTGVALLTPDNAHACHIVSKMLKIVCAKRPYLSRAHFAIVVETEAHWNVADQLHGRVTSVLQQLKLETLDMLLLKAQTLAIPADASTNRHKSIVLTFWKQMVALQQSGLVAQIGVSGFSIQQIELILMAYPDYPPIALSLVVSIVDASSEVRRLAPMVSFAHGRAMDVLVQFPFLETVLPLATRDQWTLLTPAIARRHRERKFQFATTYEADSEPFQLHTRTMIGTTALQSRVQITMRYLLQKGLVVIPIAVSGSEFFFKDGRTFEDDESQEVFHALLHPFTPLAPFFSSEKLYSSLLSSDDIVAIDQTLHLGC